MSSAAVNARSLLSLAVILAAAHGGGWLISKLRQPRVCGEIVAGILLGPSLLGLLWPAAMHYLFPTEVVASLRVVAQVGLALFMCLVGHHLDLTQLRNQGHRAIVISHVSIVVPVLLGAALGLWLHPRVGGASERLGFVLFLGAAMAITVFPVLARVLHETGLAGTRVGVLTLTCAAIDDVTAWCLLAVVTAVVGATDAVGAIATVAWSVGFVVAVVGVLRPLLARWGAVPLWAVAALALAGAWTTETIGIHAIFGAFLVGTALPRTDGTRTQVARLEAPTLAVLLPVFFVVVGVSTRIDLLDSWYLWVITALVTFVAVAGKWGGAMLAARVVGETWRDATTIGILMNTRGLTELVILTVGLELRIIGPTVFTAMVIMALTTTLMAAPLLHRTAQRDPRPASPLPQPAPAA